MEPPERVPEPRNRVCVVGVDAGGSHTRCVVAATDGTVLGRGSGPGGNVYSTGPEAADNLAAGIADTYAQVGEHEAGHLTHIFIGAAGGLATQQDHQAQVVAGIRAAGIEAPVTWSSDVTLITPGATTSPHALVASVGTGSIFARVDGFVPTTVIGGHGWLVSDEGSAVSIGIAALRHAFSVLDGIAPGGELFTAVLEKMAIAPPQPATRRDAVSALTTAVYGRPPATIGTLAPLVVDRMDVDPAAHAIASDAVATIIAALGYLQPADDTIIAAGSIAAGPHRLGTDLRTAIAETWPSATIVVGSDGAIGAAALAIQAHQGGLESAVHQRLLSTGSGAASSNDGLRSAR